MHLKHCHKLNGIPTVEYACWIMMRQRCNNPRSKQFRNYGERGITICDRWSGTDGFANFIADMGRRPSLKHQIDRINNDGPYSPENCRWATHVQQARNKRTNRLLTFRGKTQCVRAWCEELGISEGRVHWRLKHGWDVERTLTEPVKPEQHTRRHKPHL